MKLASQRSLAELRGVLLDPDSLGHEIIYWVFSEVDEDQKWSNMTVVVPGLLGREFPKTFGHYHSAHLEEVYAEVLGEGILLLQKKVLRGGDFVFNEVSEVLLVKASRGDKITIPPEYGHSWSNTGPGPLITYDNWKVGHQPQDYEFIQKLHGMAYYLTREGSKVAPIPNPNYQNLPQPVFLSASEFLKK